MKKYLLLLTSMLSIAGCTSTEQYKMYADSHAQMETAKYNAEAAKYKAMSDIANNGTEAAKVAAVMAIALGTNSGGNKTNGLQAPQQSEALQWAQILVPGVIQTVGIVANRQVAINQSNNAASVANSTNAAFVGMAGKIQAPAANITNNTDNHAQTLSGSGTLGSGAYSTTANPTTTTNTLSGTGTLGSGAYSTTANPTTSTLSGSGTLGSGAYTTTDNHSTTTPFVVPTVITPIVTTTPVFSTVPVTAVP